MFIKKQLLNIILLIIVFIINNIKCEIFEELRQQSFLFGIANSVFNNVNENGTKCDHELKMFIEGFKNNEMWTLRMLDASGVEGEIYLFGNTFWMGFMSECQDINNKNVLKISNNQNFSKNSHPPYDLKFITVAFNHNNTLQTQLRLSLNHYLHLGLCVPKSCTNDNIQYLLEKLLTKKQLTFQENYPVKVNISGLKSLTREHINYYHDPLIYTFGVYLTISVVLCIIGTNYDVFVHQINISENKLKKLDENMNKKTVRRLNSSKKNLFWEIMLCFSIYKNIQVIFSSKTNSESLPFVHGLKACGMIYVIILHVIMFSYNTTDNVYLAFRYSQMFLMQIISNSTYSVDTFLCLGGFLLSYLFYKYHKKFINSVNFFQGCFLYSQMIFHRYVRLTPAYFASLLISYTFWQMISQEYPLIQRVIINEIQSTCSQYWWRNLIYIHTFYSKDEMCLSWSWYLSTDMQCFLIGCLLLLLSTKCKKLALYVPIALILNSIFTGGFTSYQLKYVPTVEEQILAFDTMYCPISFRLGAYFVGFLAGYFMNEWNNKIPLKKSTINKISIAAIFTILYVIHGVYRKNNLSIIYIAVYMGISRVLWGSSIAWLLMICVSNQSGAVTNFLSFKGWFPVSRLSYCLYLIHPILIILTGYSSEQPLHASLIHALTISTGFLLVSLLAALLLSLLFEMPYINMLKLITSKEIKEKLKKNS